MNDQRSHFSIMNDIMKDLMKDIMNNIMNDIMDDIVNNIMNDSIVNDNFAHKPDSLLVSAIVVVSALGTSYVRFSPRFKLLS